MKAFLRIALAGLLMALPVGYSSGQNQNKPDVRPIKNDLKLLPVLFQQHAAEYRALCYQAFNIASLRLEYVQRKGLPLAIITDIDETILDNSNYEAQRIKEGNEFTQQSWKQWTSKSDATLVPGAGEFLKKAKLKEVTVFYISNRDTSEVNSTMQNLLRYQLPDADKDHMIFQRVGSSKEERRQQIMKNYDVIMLIGDNLNDFTSFFEKKNLSDRKGEVDKVQMDWGNKFIVLPNSIYGEWENALYNYQRNLATEQKNSILIDQLIGY